MPSRAASNRFWPDDIKLVVSISMQFEAGGQPAKGTDSPFPKVDFPDSVPSDGPPTPGSPMATVRGSHACSTYGTGTASRLPRT